MTLHLFFNLTVRQTAYALVVLVALSLGLCLAAIQPFGIIVSAITVVYAAACAYVVIRSRRAQARRPK